MHALLSTGCPAETVIMPDAQLLVPRWTITFKEGFSGVTGKKSDGVLGGRHGCFGRMDMNEVQATVVGRAEPHNLQLVRIVQLCLVSADQMLGDSMDRCHWKSLLSRD